MFNEINFISIHFRGQSWREKQAGGVIAWGKKKAKTVSRQSVSMTSRL
jgi:hypothetical protein